MLSRGLECFPEVWNTFNRVGIPLHRLGIPSSGLECSLQGWNAIPMVGMLSGGLEYIQQSWNTFVQTWNSF
jgi:hypothetical protein